MSAVHPDLQRERNQATFDVLQLTHNLDGGEEQTKRRRYLENLVINDPDFKIKNFSYMSREEEYDNAVRLNVLLVKKLRELKITNPADIFLIKSILSPHQPLAFGLHDSMFIQTLYTQTTPEQKDLWLEKASNYEIIGTYAQTEMGHGTFIRGLETTAHYDPSSQEFVLNSPTLTATKWWPGNLGKTVNHAIVMAQLYINNKSCGMQPFMVQLRSMEDHSSMPGVTLGDIGPKFGYNSNDNGFLRLTNVRVPRINMLMKNAQVQPDGTFVQSKDSKLTYGTMLFIRAIMLRSCASGLAECCTIATRYSAVRHQSELKPGYEPQIMYYQTQQYKLIPHIAASYAFWFTSDCMRDLYFSTQAEIEQGNLDRLPELHGLSSGLKSFISYAMSSGMEELRMSCGGHGYSHASGIPRIYVSLTPACTYEGENTVMYLQAARFLMKAYAASRSNGNLVGSVEYLRRKQYGENRIGVGLNLDALVAAYEFRAARKIAKAAEKLARLAGSGKSEQEAWNMTSVQLVQAAAAHCHLFVVKTFVERVKKVEAPLSLKKVLTQLCQFYAANGIVQNSGDFLQSGYMSAEQYDIIEEKCMSLLGDLRVNAVALVDSFDFPDRRLNSALGRYDGQVYEALYKFAIESPLNNKDVHESYYKYIRPMIKENQKSKL